MDFSEVCTPALVYLVVSSVTLVLLFVNSFNLITLTTKVAWTLLWTYILNYICTKGYKGVSWALVLLPYIVMFGVFAIVMEFTNKINTYLGQTVINQGSYVPPGNLFGTPSPVVTTMHN